MYLVDRCIVCLVFAIPCAHVRTYMNNHVHSALQNIEKEKKQNEERSTKALHTHTHNSLNGLEN